jgi:regulator of sigma E protease
MNLSNSPGLRRLLIILGAIALGLLIGYFTGNWALTQQIVLAVVLMLTALTLLVTIHELGHFLPAKWFGMRVETFSIGFPPTLFSHKRGDTEYQIGATPLGGYVKITGIIDESMDTNFTQTAPQPWEFRSKPVWQRMVVMVGGVTMNVILGILIFTGFKYFLGEVKTPMSGLQDGIEVVAEVPSIGRMLGFQTGDKLLNFKGQSFTYFEEYSDPKHLLEDDAYFEVERQGQVVRLEVPPTVQNFFGEDSVDDTIFLPNVVAVVDVLDSVRHEEGGPLFPTAGHRAGLRSGDRIIGIDTVPVRLFSEMRAALAGKADSEVAVHVLRGADTLRLTAQLDSTGKLGVAPNYAATLPSDTLRYGLGGAFLAGAGQAFSFVSQNAQGIKNMTKKGVDAGKSTLGPIGIAQIYLKAFQSPKGGLLAVLRLTAILSMVLAFVNILPIPALDGGHLLFLLIEAVTRREPSVKVRMIAQQIGMVLILGLMVLVLFNDVTRLFR